MYQSFIDRYADPRSKEWFFMSSPLPTIGLVLVYLIFVTKIGPAFMKHRKPYDLKRIMIIYNLFQTLSSAWMFYQGSILGWMTNYSLTCQPNDYISPQALMMSRISWLFFLSKFLDFTDTVIFILRKKTDQVSNLHVVHHSIVPVLCWVGVLFYPEGHYTFAGYLNTFVHTIMYGYYLLAAMGPSLRPYLWWKKYLTTIQLIQFALVLLHTAQTILNFNCEVPKPFTLVMAFQALLFYFMFINFFKKEYHGKKLKTEMKPEVCNENTIHVAQTTKQADLQQMNKHILTQNQSKLWQNSIS